MISSSSSFPDILFDHDREIVITSATLYLVSNV